MMPSRRKLTPYQREIVCDLYSAMMYFALVALDGDLEQHGRDGRTGADLLALFATALDEAVGIPESEMSAAIEKAFSLYGRLAGVLTQNKGASHGTH